MLLLQAGSDRLDEVTSVVRHRVASSGRHATVRLDIADGVLILEPRAGINDVGEDFDEVASALTRNVRERYIYGTAAFGRCALHPVEP